MMPPKHTPHRSSDDRDTSSRSSLDVGEREPLLQHGSHRSNGTNNATPNGHTTDQHRRPSITSNNNDEDPNTDTITIDFPPSDPSNPRNWSPARKMSNVFLIALMAILSPLASSMFTPGISSIAADLHTSPSIVTGATTGFVVFLGLGPLILAPLSETFGRRALYLTCFTVFAVAQIPTAMAPSIESLLAWRAVAGFFGSVGIANGGGTLSDMYEPSERAGIMGWYLLGPLLGPTAGPLLGGVTVEKLGWRWMFWILAIVAGCNTAGAWIFLKESYAPVILAWRKGETERADQKEEEGRRGKMNGSDENGRNSGGGGKPKRYRIPNEDTRPLRIRLGESIQRPVRILFTQPIVLVMSSYIAILFGTTYSLWTNFEAIYGPSSPYGFSVTQVGLLYLGPGIGFLLAVWFIVPRIDTVFNALTERNGGKSQPEFRLPLANIGAVLIPVSLFVYAWTVEEQVVWWVSIVATGFYGLGQICIMNTVQNYYIDAYAKYAASAIAAGSVFRSLLGGIMPLGANVLFDAVGYGWGISVFAAASVVLAPAPLLFYRYGPWVREKFAVDW